jgi:hypothetical protein
LSVLLTCQLTEMFVDAVVLGVIRRETAALGIMPLGARYKRLCDKD